MATKNTQPKAAPKKDKGPMTKRKVMREVLAKVSSGELPAAAPAPQRQVADPLESLRGRTIETVSLDEVCDAIIGGASLRHIALALGNSASGMLKWIERQPEGRERYARAKAEMAEFYASELMAIATEPVPVTIFGTMDSAAVQDKRMRADTVKWIASKLLPKVYGERLDVTSMGDSIARMTDDQIDARIAALARKLGVKGGDDSADAGGEAGVPAASGSEG